MSREPGASAPSARRPGRLRRWVLRPFVWGLLLLLALFAAASLFLRSDRARRLGRDFLAARLTDALGRPVSVGEVSFSLLPLELEVRDLVIPGRKPADRPFAVVPRARVLADLVGLRRPVLELRLIELERPEVYLELDPDGATNLPELATGGAGERRLEVKVDTLLVDGGSFDLDEHRLPITVEAHAVWGKLVGRGGDRFDLRAAAQEVTTTLPGAHPYPLTASLQAHLAPGRLDLTGCRLRSPDLAAGVDGTIVWGKGEADREVALEVTAQTEGRLLARLGWIEGGVEGPVALDGRVDWNPRGWGYRGRLTSPRLVLQGRRLEEVSANLLGDAASLRLELAGARYGGGRLSGTIVVGTSGEATPIDVELDLARVPLERLMLDQEIDVPGLPSEVGGHVSYRFTSAATFTGDGSAALELTAPAGEPEGIALSGPVMVDIRHGEVTVSAARLSSLYQHLAFSGVYALPSGLGAFDFEVASESIGRLARLLPGAGDPPPAWRPTAGRGTLAGTLHLGPGGVSAELRLDLAEVEAPGGRAATLTGSLAVDAAAIEPLRLELARDGGALLVTGRVPFGADPLSITLDAASWPAEDAAAWVSFPLPVGGRVSGRLDLVGTSAQLSGHLDATLEPATIEGFAADRATVRLSFDPHRVTIDAASLTLPAGKVTGQGFYDLDHDAVSLSAAAPGLALGESPFAAPLGGRLSGTLSLSARVEGPLTRPRATLDATGRSLALAGSPLGDAGTAELTAAWDGETVTVHGSLLGLVDFAGGGQLDRERADVHLELTHADLARLVQLASGTTLEGLEGTLGGTLAVAGPLSAPKELEAELRLTQLDVGYKGHELAAIEPATAHLRGSTLVLDSFYLGEKSSGSELFAAGSIGLAGDQPLALKVQSSLAAAWAEPFLPGVDLDGKLDLLGSIGGTLAKPALNGQAELHDGRVIFAGFPQSFDAVEAIVLVDSRDLVLDHLGARLGGGTLRAAGRVALFGGDPQTDYQLQVEAANVSLHYPEGFLIRGGAELTLVPTGDGRLLRGRVVLDRAYYLQDIDFGVVQLLQGLLRRQRLQVASVNPVLASTQLNVTLSAPGSVQVRNNLADLKGTADLTLRGSLARPAVFGRVEVDPGGTMVYADVEYKVERGLVTFINPTRIEPVIDVAAKAQVRSYDITLNLSGTLSHLITTLSSDPPLADLDILALLATGAPLATGGELTAPTTAGSPNPAVAQSLLYGQASAAIGERVNSLFGFDKFRIQPLSSTTGQVSGVGFTVGKRLSKDLTVTYSSLPSTTEGQVVEAEWEVSRGLVLVFTWRGNNTYSVDARWETRF